MTYQVDILAPNCCIELNTCAPGGRFQGCSGGLVGDVVRFGPVDEEMYFGLASYIGAAA